MTPEQFNGLTKNSQEKMLRLAAVLLDSIEKGTERECLFQLEGFYVTAYCRLEDNYIFHYCAFDEVDALDRYLERIRIDL
ncbi:hypothetical protein EON65_55170 [archaeon]|nr:MAG: hypothetical protein EON65_55170 [archaeon]